VTPSYAAHLDHWMSVGFRRLACQANDQTGRAEHGAVLSLTLAMSADLLADRIRVNCVTPGTIDTPWVGRLLAAAADPDQERAALEQRQPMGRLGLAEEVASAITFLASPESSFITGIALPVDGGMAGLNGPGKTHPMVRTRRFRPAGDSGGPG
jgi:Enoyl-(Acyl carrier protein) reductase